jgi:hypothetical protein
MIIKPFTIFCDDDYKLNIKQPTDAGGIGIHRTSAASTIRILFK